MQNTSERQPSASQNAISYGGDGAAGTPYIVNDQCAASLDLRIFGELDKTRPGKQTGFFTLNLGGKIN